MTIIGYYPSFRLPGTLTDADDLRALLADLWRYRYDRLYENLADGRPPGDLAQACRRLVTFLATHHPAQGHVRLLYMGWTLAQAAAPTIAGWAPDDTRPQLVLEAVQTLLERQRPINQDWLALFPDTVTPPPALHEALDVYANLARAFVPSAAPDALLEMLDDCLEGDAIFPGSDGRRDVFNWVLIEVVPAAWTLRVPDAIYTFRWPWPPPAET